jgi:hypothetical protein
MYASKLLTEKSSVEKPSVARCFMIAEAKTDAPKSFCDVPDGTGYRDKARSESSALKLGTSVLVQAGGRERNSGEVGNDRGAKGFCSHGVSNRYGGTRLSSMDKLREKENDHVF